MIIEKYKEVFADEAFVKSLFGLETAAEVQTALKEKDVEVSDKEVIALYDLFSKIKSGEITKEQLEKLQQQAENGELSEEALEQVSGGLLLTILASINIVASLALLIKVSIDYSKSK